MNGDELSSHQSSHQHEPELNLNDISQLTCVKRFIFRPRESPETSSKDSEILEVLIPERVEASYGLYVWPCAPILAWFLYENRNNIRGKKILELGAGTGLPGILCALLGADVTLSDSGKLPHCLDQSRKSIEANGLTDSVNIVDITWGLFLNTIIHLRGRYDIILGSDCFYDPSVFEDLIITVAYLLHNRKEAKFLCTYQERSSDWSIEYLLKKWGLKCKHIPLSDLAQDSRIAGEMASRGIRVFVGNLPWTIGREELRRFAEQFGQVKSSMVIFDKNTGLSKGYGFVTFASDEAYRVAANSAGTHVLDGNQIQMNFSNNN